MKCRNSAENKNVKVVKTKKENNDSSKFAVCVNKRSRYIKDQEAKGLNSLAKILISPLALLESIHKKY